MVRIEEYMALAKQVQVRVAGASLEGELWLPPDAYGLILFPHGCGISRDTHVSCVAERLRKAGLGTLCLDLLTTEEANLDAHMAAFRFDINLLNVRLGEATDWLLEQPATRGLRLGYFGTGYGAAAALLAATGRSDAVDAIVVNNSLPRYIQHALKRGLPPILVIGNQRPVALAQLRFGGRRCMVVPGANLASEDIAWLATNWFTEHLKQPATYARDGTELAHAVVA
jgi:putative phosphoribosyl transferase